MRQSAQRPSVSVHLLMELLILVLPLATPQHLWVKVAIIISFLKERKKKNIINREMTILKTL